MIVYAYYGLGKTTLAKNSDLFVDADFQYYFDEIEEYKQFVYNNNKIGKIVLINSPIDIIPNELIDVVFVYKDIDDMIERLNKRLSNVTFINHIVENKSEIVKEFDCRFDNIRHKIIVPKETYLSDYRDFLIDLQKHI